MYDIRIVFMGSPDFAVPTLSALSQNFSVVGVITQPDRPAGRGKSLRACAVKERALALGHPVYQPDRINTPETIEALGDWRAQVAIVVAYGQILKQDILNAFEYGCVNVHASLLPNWRGASPIQASILNGDHETGITIMKMDKGMDTGPILAQKAIALTDQITGGGLFEKLSGLGADFLVDTLPAYIAGNIYPTPQAHDQATYTKMIRKSDGQLDPGESAEQLARQVRAYEPWPTSFFRWEDRRFVVRKAHIGPDLGTSTGTISLHTDKPALQTVDGSLVIDLIQPAGKKVITGNAFLNGYARILQSTIE